jgi:serine/threonine protein phosphatase PrpC
MTRSMGDLVAKTVGVTFEPEIKSFSNLSSKTDRIVVVASDGLWDRIPNDEITRMLIPYYERRDPDGAVSRLV